MSNSTSSQPSQDHNNQNERQLKQVKNFSFYYDILLPKAKSRNITVEELMKDMRSQSLVTFIPHEEVMEEIQNGIEYRDEDEDFQE